MTVFAVLLALLAIAALGGDGGARSSGRGLASGLEAVAVGVLVGPAVLGLVPADLVASFAPLGYAAAAWVAVVIGLDYGFAGPRRIPLRRIAGSVLLTLVPFAAVAGAVAAVLALANGTGYFATREQEVMALGVGAVLAGSTRNAILWAIARTSAKGPLTELLHDLSDAGDLVPVLAAAWLAAPDASPVIFKVGGLAGAAAAPLVLGAVLGLGAALLIRFDARHDAMAAALLGTALVAFGLSVRFGVSTIASTFALGFVTASAARDRGPLRELAWRLERPVLLPALVIAGALVDPRASPELPSVAAGALAALVLGKAVAAGALAFLSPVARRAGPLLAPALVTPGPFGTCLGLALAARHPGPVGRSVLTCAAAAAVLGEMLSALALRRALARAGECGPAKAAARPDGQLAQGAP